MSSDSFGMGILCTISFLEYIFFPEKGIYSALKYIYTKLRFLLNKVVKVEILNFNGSGVLYEKRVLI